MVDNFFECNSISATVFDVYEELCLEKNKRLALTETYRLLSEEYSAENDSKIIFLMTLYYCGLKNGFSDPKIKQELETIAQESLFDCFDKDDLGKISSVLTELLGLLPIITKKKKNLMANQGSKNWKVGDLYGYPLCGEMVEKVGLSGKYAVIYCSNISKVTSTRNDIELYIFICEGKTIGESPKDILNASMPVFSSALDNFYLFLLPCNHRKYPTEKLIFLGNFMDFIHMENEIIPTDKLFIPRLVWERFDDIVAFAYNVTKKHSGLPF